jgi:hypothetical protein
MVHMAIPGPHIICISSCTNKSSLLDVVQYTYLYKLGTVGQGCSWPWIDYYYSCKRFYYLFSYSRTLKYTMTCPSMACPKTSYEPILTVALLGQCTATCVHVRVFTFIKQTHNREEDHPLLCI